MLYAIVDIETTGSYALGNGITEIGIVIHDGSTVLHFYESLVNPDRHIPIFIQSLTGISNEMVANAPQFHEIAGQVHELLQDKIFVAHNVNFDYSFVKHHLQEAGYTLDARKLCTVRLSRKIIPGLKGYSLGKLCDQLDINLTNHHRAGGDALATADLLRILLERDTENAIGQMLKGKNREQYLPPHLPVAELDNLPTCAGVYYFYNATGKIVYIGKANNIFKRVKSHFANNKPGKQKQDFLRDIHHISYTPCATELMAHVLESTEIRRLWPVHNRSQRGYLPKFGLYVYEDRQGFKRFAIEKHKPNFKAIYTFNTIVEGHQRIRELISEFGLCTRLCNLTAACSHGVLEDGCTDPCASTLGLEHYNQQVDEAIQWMEQNLPTFALMDKGIQDNEESCILVRKGNVYGMGYIKGRHSLNNIDILQQNLQPLQDNDYIRNLIYKHATAFPEKCVAF